MLAQLTGLVWDQIDLLQKLQGNDSTIVVDDEWTSL
jgi:hypothetical protein